MRRQFHAHTASLLPCEPVAILVNGSGRPGNCRLPGEFRRPRGVPDADVFTNLAISRDYEWFCAALRRGHTELYPENIFVRYHNQKNLSRVLTPEAFGVEFPAETFIVRSI